MHLNSIIWNIDPEILGLGKLSIRWYGLLFAASFFFGYILLIKFFKKEKLDPEMVEKVAIYTAIGTILGARLGHCLFYEPEYYLSKPIEILKIYKGGLASHGAAIGIVLSLYFFIRKFHWNFIWLLDRVVIVVALSGLFIRSGNLMNSEIYGQPTNSSYGFIYAHDLTSDLVSMSEKEGTAEIKSVRYKKAGEINEKKLQPMTLSIEFDKKERKKEKIEQFVSSIARSIILNQENYHDERNVLIPEGKEFSYEIKQSDNKTYIATIPIFGVPRHPTQIYEALSYFLIFLLLISIYFKKEAKFKGGLLLSSFLILVFSARFLIEFIKEEQVAKENDMILNLGQKLSIPIVIIGIIILIISIKRNKVLTQTKS